jgi:hypothetical protein|tara:strand:- start:353 stop:574 length:222 start_codon:yes stop_codon:yes gene_type:complete
LELPGLLQALVGEFKVAVSCGNMRWRELRKFVDYINRPQISRVEDPVNFAKRVDDLGPQRFGGAWNMGIGYQA